MTHNRFYKSNVSLIRKSIERSVELSDQIHQLEAELVSHLYKMDQDKIYVRVGFKSLRAFCVQGLKFGHTQGQRITTRVRRYVPTSNIGIERSTHRLDEFENIEGLKS